MSEIEMLVIRIRGLELKLAAGEAKCERIKEALDYFVNPESNGMGTVYLDFATVECVKTVVANLFNEPASTSLDLYHKERNKKELGEVLLSSKKLGSWLSAALDDGQACNEFKADIRRWFEALSILKHLTE